MLYRTLNIFQCISNEKRWSLPWPPQRSYWPELCTTCRPIVDVSTCMILDRWTHRGKNVQRLKFHFWNIHLEKRVKVKSSRLLKVLDTSYILVQPIWLQLWKLSSGSHLKFTLDTMGKWTLTYKTKVNGHSRKKKMRFVFLTYGTYRPNFGAIGAAV